MNANATCLVSPTDSDQFLDEAEQLIWSLLDDQLSEEGVLKLESLIREHISVREAYLNCISLHAELNDYFGKPFRNMTQSGTTTELPAGNAISVHSQAAGEFLDASVVPDNTILSDMHRRSGA